MSQFPSSTPKGPATDVGASAHSDVRPWRDRVTAWKYAAILGLQMGQVFPATFFGLVLTAIYRERGLSLDMLWVFTIPSIATWLRPLWAPWVDRWGSVSFGRRKTWIVPCTLLGAAAYLSVGFFEPTIANLPIIIAMLTIKSFIMATQDTAVDGYTVENLSDEERRAGAATIDIARNVASFSAMVGIVTVYGIFGWQAATTLAAALLVVFSVPAILRQEPPPPIQSVSAQNRGEKPSLLTTLRRRDAHWVLPLVALVSFAGGLIPSLYVPYLVDMGFTVKEIGPLILAPASLVGTVVGSSAAAWVIGRLGYRTTALLSAALMIPTVGLIIWMGSIGNPSLLLVFMVTLVGITLPSFLTVTMIASRIKWTSKTQSGTDYSAQVVVGVMAAQAALAIGGVLAEHLGWMWYFILSGSLIVAACFVFWRVFPIIEAMVEERDEREVAARAGTGPVAARPHNAMA